MLWCSGIKILIIRKHADWGLEMDLPQSHVLIFGLYDLVQYLMILVQAFELKSLVEILLVHYQLSLKNLFLVSL